MGTYTAGDLGSTCCPCYFAITQPLGALPLSLIHISEPTRPY